MGSPENRQETLQRTFKVGFGPGAPHAPVALEAGANLSERLTIQNSPILFGCRTGICGTCLIEVIEGGEKLHAKSDQENDLLPIIADGNPDARLACQIRLNADIAIKRLEQK